MNRFAVVLCAALLARPAQADLITPDSISPVPAGPVTDQYRSLGLLFGLGGATTVQFGGWVSRAVPSARQTVAFVLPGTDTTATTDSLRVHFFANGPSAVVLEAFGRNGNLLSGVTQMVWGAGSDFWLTIQAPGIASFETRGNRILAPGGQPMLTGTGYQMTAIEFDHLQAAPEPGGLVLLGLGMALAGGAWARRRSR